MADAPKKRFARTPETILLALGCMPNREMKLRLKLWRTYPDFPKKQRNGYDIDQLKQFVDSNAGEFIKDAKRAKILQDGESFSSADLKLFSATGGNEPSFSVGADEFPEFIEGMDRLGALIMRRFAGRLTTEVRRMQIQHWKKLEGVAKRPGLVPFPSPRESNRYNVRECFDWVEKWVLIDSQVSPGDLFGGAANLDVKIKEVNLRRAERLEAFEQGNLVPFAAVKGYISGLGGRLAKFYERLIEDAGGIRRIVQEESSNAGVPAEVRALIDTRLAAALAAANDGVKQEFLAAREFALAEVEKIRKAQQEASI